MLEKPNLPDEKIVTCLKDTYGIPLKQVTFLPLGRDVNTAVYRLLAADDQTYFLKLRKGHFDETPVTLAKFLSDQNIDQIIPPLPTSQGQLWGQIEPFRTILYPFVDGKNGYEATLSKKHWAEFGAALKAVHSVDLPLALHDRLRVEAYSPTARQTVRQFLERIETDVWEESVARKTADFLKSKRTEIIELIDRADQRAETLLANPTDLVVCHSDLHAGNILIGQDEAFYIVDWDEPILAPKERDLMYIGSGLLASKRSPEEEAALFYPTYGQTQLNPTALSYYRYERIIQDIFESCKQLLLTDEGGEDREQGLYYLKSNFLPNHTIDIAYQADIT